MVTASRAIIGGALASGVIACGLIVGIDDHNFTFAEVDAEVADAAIPDPCSHAAPPGPPDADDDPFTKNTYLIVFRTIDPLATDDGGGSATTSIMSAPALTTRPRFTAEALHAWDQNTRRRVTMQAGASTTPSLRP